jgi:hypothetical protein
MPLPDEDIDRQLELLLVATASRAVDFTYIEHWFAARVLKRSDRGA